jgi:hypothetical protein
MSSHTCVAGAEGAGCADSEKFRRAFWLSVRELYARGAAAVRVPPVNGLKVVTGPTPEVTLRK